MTHYRFTIIIAVYNTASYLQETVDSILHQEYDAQTHGAIQLILVDDGSQDDSPALCDRLASEHPETILALHQQNAGVAAARNAALSYIRGDIVNFLDSDDKLSPNTLRLVDDFFRIHATETDLCAIPMRFFDAATGDHILNDKFAKGTRVIDLEAEPSCIQLSMSSAFLLWERAGELCFDTRLKFAEDAKEALKILAKRKTLGVVAEACYHYRRRRHSSSALQQSSGSPAWYFPHLEYFNVDALARHRDADGRIPKFVQWTVMYDMQWNVRFARKTIEDVLGARTDEFMKACFDVIQDIDDDVILGQRQIFASHKCMLLKKKHHAKAVLAPKPEENDIAISCAGYELAKISTCAAKWEFLRLGGDGSLILEGYTGFIGLDVSDLEDIETYLLLEGKNGKTWLRCEQDRSHPGRVDNAEAFGELIFPAITYHARIDLAPYQALDIRLYTFWRGLRIERRTVKHGLFFPIVDVFPHAYARLGGWLAETAGDTLRLRRASAWTFLQRELQLWRDFRHSGRPHAMKAMGYRMAYHIAKRLLPRDLWLVSDRIRKADDNGEAFFHYLAKTGRHPHACFVLHRQSEDWARVRQYGRILPYHSFQHRLLQLVAQEIISSAADDFVMNPFGDDRAFYWDILKKKRLIFLQHGIIKDDLSRWLGKPHRDLGIFVTSAPQEYSSVMHGDYGYGSDVVKMTGLPRYDDLENHAEKRITIMPTWRNALGVGYDEENGRRLYAPGYQESAFFRFYDALLNDERLLHALKEKGYTLQFLPHPNILPMVPAFRKAEGVIFCDAATRYRDIFETSSLIVTDYSSVAFDFAYLKKPVLYAQFDRAEFFRGHTYTQGYFDYDTMGFGEVETTLAATVDRILDYVDHDCRLKPEYEKRIRSFFAYHDHDNCRRVYEAILKYESSASLSEGANSRR